METHHNKETDLIAAMDSVNIIDELLLKPELTDEEKESVENNVEHLKIIIERHSLGGEEANVFQKAIKKVKWIENDDEE